MSVPPHIAQTLADLRARRDYLDMMIHGLSTIWEAPAAAPVVEQLQLPRAASRTKRATVARERRAAPTNGSTTTTGNGDRILAALKKAGGVIAPGELAKVLSMDRATLRRHTDELIAKGQVVATGATASRRLSLPGKPAKEEP